MKDPLKMNGTNGQETKLRLIGYYHKSEQHTIICFPTNNPHLISMNHLPFPPMKHPLHALLLLLLSLVPALRADTPPLALWYDQPATNWMLEALPIGNGHLGAMIFGGMKKEQIQFNEESLWIGDEQDTGAYQAFGDVFVEFAHSDGTNYRRELDLDRAVHTVTYQSDGVTYRNESFASAPAKVMVFRFTADKPGALTGNVTLTDMHAGKITAEKNKITSLGSLKGYTYTMGSAKKNKDPHAPYGIHLNYEAQVLVINDGGTVETSGDKIAFKDANSVTLLLSAGTDFVQDRSKGWQGELPHKKVTARLDAAANRPYEDLLADHLKDYRAMFARVALDLGPGNKAAAALPTDQRLANYPKSDPEDTGLEELLFQYGRYLLIASSRPGGLPANLQGKWNNENLPPWRCDYHTNVNLQMNYWPADVANLSECFEPFAEWLNSIREVRIAATRNELNKAGWAMRGESGLFGGSTWEWQLGGAAWLLQNSYDHYRFTGDKEYLRTRAYPAMKEVCAFWIDSLITEADGTLVAPIDYSPEHGPKETGIAFNQQWVWDLFTSTIEASEVLGVDAELREQLTEMKARLLPPKTGSWGQLLEWRNELTAESINQSAKKDPTLDTPANKHRHLSHLVGLFPGRQISLLKTPELAEAARVSLHARGDVSTGWSTAHKINLWARLQDGDRAHKLINNLMNYVTSMKTTYGEGGGVYPNLLCAHPPFQIDGNLGYTAGVCEMLLQTNLDEIHLLPALPKAWPSGGVKGLRARGDFTVDIDWREGKVTGYRIASREPKEVKLRINGETKTVLSERL